MTFRLGLSYLPLVEAGLAALEGWMQHLPLDSLRPYLQEILPLLDGYLNATVIQGIYWPLVYNRNLQINLTIKDQSL